MKVLDLFCGLGGFSQAFEDDLHWRVTTLDIQERFDPDIEADILDVSWDDFDQDYDLILASPPCKGFSIADGNNVWKKDTRPPSPKSKQGIMMVYHTMGLCKALDPDWWFMENPRGMMRKVIGAPQATITLCQYGEKWMKPTDLWGRHPPSFRYRKCSEGSNCHESVSVGDVGSGLQATRNPAERAKMPYGLSEAIKEAVENPDPNPATEW